MYLLNVRYATVATETADSAKASSIDIAVRAGYFGLCARNAAHGVWRCGSDAFAIRAVLGIGLDDTLGAIATASSFRSDVVFPGLL